MQHRRLLRCAAASLLATVAVFAACSATEDPNEFQTSSGTPTGSGAAGASGGAGGATGTGGLDLDAGHDADLTPDAACASVTDEAELTVRPIDIVFIVDNSGSMFDDIAAVQSNINDNFAAIIAAAGVDFRVIMLSLGVWTDTAEAICIEAPLSSAATCNPIPAEPGQNPPIFFHYSREITSKDSVCKLFGTYDGTLTDDLGLWPDGWSQWLRPEAFKIFVEMSDDGMICDGYDDGDNAPQGTAVAAAFDSDLLALDPTQFGDATTRNYLWHSIVGLPAKAQPGDPYLPAEPIALGTCDTGETPGTGYQGLSILTGGLRFPICEHNSYAPVFNEIANAAIDVAIACSFPLPEAPAGETIDLDTLEVEYTPGDGSGKQTFVQVDGPSSCAPGAFYLADGIVTICPAACDVVQSDGRATVSVLYDCESIAN
jgi:hypothetical protein